MKKGLTRNLKCDIISTEKSDVTGGYDSMPQLISQVLGFFPNFAAWYVLQHYSGTLGIHRAFVTEVEIIVPFNIII